MKPRVLYINHTVHKSGAAISLGTLIGELADMIEPFFLLRGKSKVDAILRVDGHSVQRERWMPEFMTTRYTSQYPMWLFLWHIVKMPVACMHLFRLVRRWNIQLIHLNETTLVVYALAAQWLGIPVIIHARTAIANRWFERFLLNWVGKRENVRFIAIDDEVRASLPADCQRAASTIYNPIDLGPDASAGEVKALRESWGCSERDIVIGQVASLHAAKGIWQILDLAEKLCPEYPHVRFVLVGDDSGEVGEGPALRKAILKRKLTGRVILAGYQSKLSVVYGALDIALCLFSEGLGGVGRTAYEAAVAGKPLIATLPEPELSSTLKTGIMGLVCRRQDTEAITQSLKRLIESKHEREQLGTDAKQSLGGRHRPDHVASEVRKVYDSLLSH